MKHFLCFFATVVIFAASAIMSKAGADQLPTSVNDKLQQREQQFNHTTFSWRLTQKETMHPRPPTDVAALEKKARKLAVAEMNKRGITDKAAIQKQSEGAAKDVYNLTQGYSNISTDVWSFQRNVTETLAIGTHYQQYYAGAAGLVAPSGSSTERTQGFIKNTSVWRSLGESTQYRCPFQSEANLSPEHLASLMALNPLKMYQAKWEMVMASSTKWILKTSVNPAADGPYAITLTLDKAHDAFPTMILFQKRGERIQFDLSSFQQSQGEWVAKRVKVTDNLLGIQLIEQDWALQDAKPTKPFKIVLKDKAVRVADYRLLGDNLTAGDVIFGVKNEDGVSSTDHVVLYPWKGQLPSLEDLKNIEAKEFPGEAAPDPSQSTAIPLGLTTPAARSSLTASALPFAGGLLCLVGGMWMFQHRRAK